MPANAPRPGNAASNSTKSPKTDLKSLPMAEVEKKLGSSPDGLTQAEAEKRLTQYGPNEIEEKKDQCVPEIPLLFLGTDSLDDRGGGDPFGVVRHWPDFGIILLLLVRQRGSRILGGTPGGQRHCGAEGEAGDQGDGETRWEMDQSGGARIGAGDVIRVRLGDIVPADARLLDGDPVEVDQSALTGESLPATRKSGEAVFSGSIVRQGEIDALVYATGANTYFGKTAQLVQRRTPSAIFSAPF